MVPQSALPLGGAYTSWTPFHVVPTGANAGIYTSWHDAASEVYGRKDGSWFATVYTVDQAVHLWKQWNPNQDPVWHPTQTRPIPDLPPAPPNSPSSALDFGQLSTQGDLVRDGYCVHCDCEERLKQLLVEILEPLLRNFRG